MRKLAPVQVSTSDTILGGGEVLNFLKNTLWLKQVIILFNCV